MLVARYLNTFEQRQHFAINQSLGSWGAGPKTARFRAHQYGIVRADRRQHPEQNSSIRPTASQRGTRRSSSADTDGFSKTRAPARRKPASAPATDGQHRIRDDEQHHVAEHSKQKQAQSAIVEHGVCLSRLKQEHIDDDGNRQ